MAIAQNVVRQPSAVPSSAPAACPDDGCDRRAGEAGSTVHAPSGSLARGVVAVLSATARNPAFARALSTRVMSRRENTGVIAPMTWLPANTRRQTINVSRGGQRRANAAITWRADDHTDCECGGQQARSADRDVKFGRDRGEQSREHEFWKCP